eukprot:m.230913 g.230913  ORF g.230913 m.230913 type:complete len:790 (-) comp18190_c0_seq1:367-2736(-)
MRTPRLFSCPTSMVLDFAESLLFGAMRRPGVLISALICSIGMVSAAFEPITDVPYPETVAHRFTSASTPSVPNWGQVPWSSASQVVSGAVGTTQGAFVLANNGNGLYFVVGATGARILPVQTAFSQMTRLLVDSTGHLRAIVQYYSLEIVNCSMLATSVSCTRTNTIRYTFGQTHDAVLISYAAAVPPIPVPALYAYVASDSGLHYINNGFPFALFSQPTLSVAFSPLLNLTAASTQDFVFIYSGSTKISQEWVTDLTNAWGGAYDGPALSMAFHPTNGNLYLANPVCVNIRYPNATIARLDWLQGLPVNETTSLAVTDDTLWVGTSRGVTKHLFSSREWSYFYLERYLPGKSKVISLALNGPSTYVLTDGGLSILETQMWTLARKAAHYEDILLKRHDRVGLVSGCDMASFGDLSSCTCHDDDNNGLWTSVVVAAEAFRFAVTGDPDARDAALHFFGGLQLLNAISGIPGLMARSATRPGEQHGDGHWYNSTVSQYRGWQWKGDTSSDEVVGHMFAIPLVSRLLYSPPVNPARTIVENIMSYIVKNNYYLIDVTGQHTLWGVWNPKEINYGRNYSDEHGVNSLQMLAYLLQVQYLTNDPTGIFSAAYRDLTSPTNHYATNTINAKIESPDDDNYSDDELTFLPYYTLFTAAAGPDDSVLRSGLQRTWRAVRSLRSNLWNAIYIAVDGTSAEQSDVDSIAWNLRTWPLEMISWPVRNSHRRDLRFDIDADRFGKLNGDSVRVLPANERLQERWNGNPHDLDGGNGLTETDPGAWLLPYWLARYHGLIVD